MARPERNNVDYFPFICEDGNKMFYIEETYGNDGFSTFVKLLRELAKTNYHYLDLSKPTTVMFLSAKCKVSKEVLLSIIKDCVELGKFDSVLWNENSIIWCQDFIDSIQDAYSKRNNKCITYDGLLLLLTSLGVRKPSKRKTTVPINPQSIVEYSIEEENKVYKSFKHLSISIGELEKLKVDYTISQIDGILESIENYRNNKNYVSLYLTAKKWLEKEYPKTNIENPNGIGKTNQKLMKYDD